MAYGSKAKECLCDPGLRRLGLGEKFDRRARVTSYLSIGLINKLSPIQ